MPPVAVLGTAPFSDPDTFWHTVAGRELSTTTWQFVGPASLATSTQLPVRLGQWLPELVLAGADALAGPTGVVWVFTLVLVGFLVSLSAICRG